MGKNLLIYDGTTYELQPDAAKDLLGRGVIVAGPSGDTPYELSRDHQIDEVEPLATVLEQRDAPPTPRLARLRVRGLGLFGGSKNQWFPVAADEDETKDR